MPSMDISGLISPYDLNSRTTGAPPRAFQAPHIDLNMPLFASPTMSGQIPYQPTAFQYEPAPAPQYNVQPMYQNNYPATLQPSATYPGAPDPMHPAAHQVRRGYQAPSQRPTVKTETASPIIQHGQGYYDASSVEDYKLSSPAGSEVGPNFATDVDTLMRAIQAKSKPTQPRPHQQEQPKQRQQQQPHSIPKVLPVQSEVVPAVPNQYGQEQAAELASGSSRRSGAKARKRYQCSMPDCGKSFYQKTHLEIHTRAHTGVKPFLCREPSCGQRFSQLGNLKTHERRHTGERPYQCEICGKTFAQRGNVRAHKIVHQQIKPFTCKLDDCGKQFTQLGNLKSHQNKFHAPALRALTTKFATIQEGDPVSAQDKELWEYFAQLYKNSNKGIKGRGKDRRISALPNKMTSSFDGQSMANAGYGTGPDNSHTESQRSSRSSSTSSMSHDGGPVITHPAHLRAHQGMGQMSMQRTDLDSEDGEGEEEGYDFGAMDVVDESPHYGAYDAFPERKMY